MANSLPRPPDHGSPERFRVLLICYIADEELRSRLCLEDSVVGDGIAVPEHGEFYYIPSECVSDEKGLDKRLAIFRTAQRVEPGQILIVSDRLVERSLDGKLRASPTAGQLREQFRNGGKLCGLIALECPAHHVSDIDWCVPPGADRGALREVILHAAYGLRLKAPPPVRTNSPPTGGVAIEAVQSKGDLRQCLALRKRVYSLMGYLPEDVESDPSGLEMDCYDTRSIHFAARLRTGEIVGTSRLVVDLPQGQNSSSGSQIRILDIEAAIGTRVEHAKWCSALAESLGEPMRRRRVAREIFMPLPILQSTEFRSQAAQALRRMDDGVELSRVVVAPRYRGLNLSRYLIDAAVAKALELRRKVVLLECIPAHEAMYKKRMFRRMFQDLHSRPTDLDQYAVAMELRLDQQGPPRDHAHKLLSLIESGKHPYIRSFNVPAAVLA